MRVTDFGKASLSVGVVHSLLTFKKKKVEFYILGRDL